MDLYLAFASAAIQGILFAFFSIQVRRMQELGGTAQDTMLAQRWALIPAAALLAATWDGAAFIRIFSNSAVALGFGALLVLWGIRQYFHNLYRNAGNSSTFLDGLKELIQLPSLLAFGFLINSEYPNAWSLLAIACFVASVLIRPAPHSKAKIKSALRYSIPVTIGLILLVVGVGALNSNLYRQVLLETNTAGEVFFVTALFLTGIMLVTNLFFWIQAGFGGHSASFGRVRRQFPWQVWSIPVLWFAGSLFEGLSYSALPAYLVVVLSSLSIVLFFISDLYFRRIQPTASGFLSVGFVLAGAACASWAAVA